MKHVSTTQPTMIGDSCQKAFFFDAFSSKESQGEYVFHHSLSFDCGNKGHFTFTGKGPRKGWRTPLNTIICSEQRDSETGYGYFGARYLDHELTTMWLSVDPMADKYLSLSPYNYCEWNPLKLVDLDGEEVWTLNKSGELIWVRESEKDVIKAMDGTSVELSTGVLERRKSYTKNDGYMGIVLDNNTGGDEGQKLFEFMADHSNVEFSLIGVYAKDPNDGTLLTCSILTTSYDSKGDEYGSSVTHSLGKTVISHYHNHPNGYTAPSSSLTNTEFEGLNDRDFYKKIRENNPNCRFFIYGEYQRGGRYRECEGDNEGKFTKSQYNKKLVYGK